MNTPTIVFCVVLPVFFAGIAILTHLVQCHTETLQRTHLSAPKDFERYHYSRLPQFLEGDQT